MEMFDELPWWVPWIIIIVAIAIIAEVVYRWHHVMEERKRQRINEDLRKSHRPWNDTE